MIKMETSKSENSTKRKEKHRRGQKKDKMKPPTKIVIRHLPPTMTEEEFLKQIELPEYDNFYYSAADWSLGYLATSRAYVTLKDYADVFLFRDRFDGYVFVDSKGAEYTAIVEFAPFQGFLKNRSRRSDNKVNTIEQEPHYQQFLAKLEEEREAAAKGSEVKLEFSLERKKEEITSTPLLQYLANKKEKRREEAKKRSEEKRRQRNEEKERRRQQQQQQQQQITKVIVGHSNAKSGGSGGANKDGNEATGERKNSRAKRKAEREQRRKEQRENAKDANEITEQGSSSVAATAIVEEKAGREPKKYSEKRERDRERNRNRKEKERQEKQEKQKQETHAAGGGASTSSSGTAAASKTEENLTRQLSKEEQISETVRNFIRSVANVKEFVPKHKQLPSKQEENMDSKQTKQTDQKLPTETSGELSKASGKPSQSSEDSGPQSSFTGGQKKSELNKHKEQQQKREERRIRNKDRPSIAIYQPKPRQLNAADGDVGNSAASSSKDTRKTSISDGESSKKDVSKSNKKKVSRYSERRAAAAAAGRHKSGDDVDENNVGNLRKSTSSEDAPRVDHVNEKPRKSTSSEDAIHVAHTDEKQPESSESNGNETQSKRYEIATNIDATIVSVTVATVGDVSGDTTDI